MGGNGYRGAILRVNLSTGQVKTEELNKKETDMFLGGRGLGAALLYREVPPHTDPLGPDNKLIFITGPLTGTAVPGSSKYVVLTKSPLTNIYLMSVSSRDFGVQLKKAGYDALIVEGKAPSPVYLHIVDAKVEIKDASKIWGMQTERTELYLRDELNDNNIKIASIGPAGENQVLYASIMNEMRAAGRGGPGAVMGSKNLKAVAVRGTGKIEVYNPEAFAETVKEAYKELADSPRTSGFRKAGTVGSVTELNKFGILPVKNWQSGYWPEAEKLSVEVMREKYLLKNTMCAPCVSHCGKLMMVKEGPYAGTVSEGPEYETLYSYGSCCGVSDFDAVIYADVLCDQYGLDSMSAGVTLAFAIECFEKGIITEKETGGIRLAFGEHKYFGELIRQTAYKEGLGALLALGSKRMAEHCGQGSEAFAMHAKGMEMGGYDPRAIKGMATVYACGPRGGCHHAGGRTVPGELDSQKFDRLSDTGKAMLTKSSRDARAAQDAMISCTFCSPSTPLLAKLLTNATGVEYTLKDLAVIGERISYLERAFNCREGIRRADDTLPKRLLEETLDGGPSSPVNLEVMLDEFYTACGWDIKTGVPLREKLEEMGLTEVAKDLYDTDGQ